METPGINFSTAPASASNCHIRALPFRILILGAAPVHLVLRGTTSGTCGSPRRRRQTSARRSANDASLSLAQAEVSGGGRCGVVLVGDRARVAVREPVVQAPHTRGGGPAGPAAGDDNYGVLVLLVFAGAGFFGPPRYADALAVVGDDHVA